MKIKKIFPAGVVVVLLFIIVTTILLLPGMGVTGANANDRNDERNNNVLSSNTQRISFVDIGGTTVDIWEDEILNGALDDVGALFTAEVLNQFGADTSSLPMATSFFRGSRYGDIWVFGTANKEYRYTAVIEYGTNKVIEIYAEAQ